MWMGRRFEQEEWNRSEPSPSFVTQVIHVKMYMYMYMYMPNAQFSYGFYLLLWKSEYVTATKCRWDEISAAAKWHAK
jgi:hypothetical protein